MAESANTPFSISTDPRAHERRIISTVSSAGTVVHIRHVDEDGRTLEWNARWHRRRRQHETTADRTVSWWLSALFLVGAALFICGGVLAYTDTGRLADWANLAGSIPFSGGAVLAVVEANRACARLACGPGVKGLWSTTGGRAAIIQVVSAVGFFQIAMVAAMFGSLDWVTTDIWLWTTSTIGSVGFVVSGWMYVAEANPADDIGTRSTWVNLLGSVCFLVGSVAGYFSAGTVRIPTNDITTPAFLIGAIAFTVGSALGLAELRQPLRDHQTIAHPGLIAELPSR